MKGFTEALPLVFCVAIAIAAVYTYGLAVGVNDNVVKKPIAIEKDIYLLGNSLEYSKLFLDTALKYSTYQALYDPLESTLPTKEEFQTILSEKINQNLNKYTEKNIVFFDKSHEVDLPKYDKTEVVLENQTFKIKSRGEKIKVSQDAPTEKISLGKDSSVGFELKYALFDEAQNFVKQKTLESELTSLINTFPATGEMKLSGCENREKETEDFDVFNSVYGSEYASLADAESGVLAKLTEEASKLISKQSTNTTKWEFFVLGKPTKSIIANCQTKKDDMCENNQSYSYTKTCGFEYSYQINSSIQLTDLTNKYPVESGTLLDKKVSLENLRLNFIEVLDLKSNSVI